MSETPSFSERMRARADRTWRAILRHRFFREVATDAINDRVFARYLRIEYGFVDTAARTLGYAVAKAPSFQERRRLGIGLYGLVTDLFAVEHHVRYIHPFAEHVAWVRSEIDTRGPTLPKLGKHAQARSLRRRWRLKSRCTTRPTLGDRGFDPRDRSALPRSGECARFMGGSSIRKNRQFLGKPAGTWYSFQESPTSLACSCHKRRVTRTSA
jgi:hypothetical protein